MIFPIGKPSKVLLALKNWLLTAESANRKLYDDKIEHEAINRPYDSASYFAGLMDNPNKSLTKFQQQVSTIFFLSEVFSERLFLRDENRVILSKKS
jgi:hypothetical protein